MEKGEEGEGEGREHARDAGYYDILQAGTRARYASKQLGDLQLSRFLPNQAPQ